MAPSSSESVRVCLTVGVFDMFHSGHLRLLSRLRQSYDYVVVGVHDNASTYINKKVHLADTLAIRVLNVELLANEVFEVFSADPSQPIKNTVEDLRNRGYSDITYVRGNDWRDFPGREMVESLKIPVKFLSTTEGVSSTTLRGLWWPRNMRLLPNKVSSWGTFVHTNYVYHPLKRILCHFFRSAPLLELYHPDLITLLSFLAKTMAFCFHLNLVSPFVAAMFVVLADILDRADGAAATVWKEKGIKRRYPDFGAFFDPICDGVANVNNHLAFYVLRAWPSIPFFMLGICITLGGISILFFRSNSLAKNGPQMSPFIGKFHMCCWNSCLFFAYLGCVNTSLTPLFQAVAIVFGLLSADAILRSLRFRAQVAWPVKGS